MLPVTKYIILYVAIERSTISYYLKLLSDYTNRGTLKLLCYTTVFCYRSSQFVKKKKVNRL